MQLKKKKKINFFEIVNIGQEIEKVMSEYTNDNHMEFTMFASPEEFEKIDEDMYYRQFPDGKDFQPSDNTIIVNFDRLVIFIKKKEEN